MGKIIFPMSTGQIGILRDDAIDVFDRDRALAMHDRWSSMAESERHAANAGAPGAKFMAEIYERCAREMLTALSDAARMSERRK